MAVDVSRLAEVSPSAVLEDDVRIGPFCVVGPEVRIGRGTRLDSNVVVTGRTTLGDENRLFPGCVIGGEPQDLSYEESNTPQVIIGNRNVFREGVTVNRGAQKEDHITRIDDGNMLMANSHVAHNCHVYNNVILVNGVLLGGHVHVHDNAIVSGNSVVHHFSTIGRLSFVSGGCRVPHDIPPFMLAAGSDNPTLKTINIVGMRRQGISESSIDVVRQAFRMLYRRNRSLDEVRAHFAEELNEIIPIELEQLLTFVENQRKGRLGRAREAARTEPQQDSERKSA